MILKSKDLFCELDTTKSCPRTAEAFSQAGVKYNLQINTSSAPRGETNGLPHSSQLERRHTEKPLNVNTGRLSLIHSGSIKYRLQPQ